MNARLDEIVTEPGQHLGADPARCIDRRNQIRKDAVKISHDRKHAPRKGLSAMAIRNAGARQRSAKRARAAIICAPASRCRHVHDVGALRTVIRSTHAAHETTITTASIVPTQRAKDAEWMSLAPSFYPRQRNEMRSMQPYHHPNTSGKSCICNPHIAQKHRTKDVHRCSQVLTNSLTIISRPAPQSRRPD